MMPPRRRAARFHTLPSGQASAREGVGGLAASPLANKRVGAARSIAMGSGSAKVWFDPMGTRFENLCARNWAATWTSPAIFR
jgi:hypothetical protein